MSPKGMYLAILIPVSSEIKNGTSQLRSLPVEERLEAVVRSINRALGNNEDPCDQSGDSDDGEEVVRAMFLETGSLCGIALVSWSNLAEDLEHVVRMILREGLIPESWGFVLPLQTCLVRERLVRKPTTAHA